MTRETVLLQVGLQLLWARLGIMVRLPMEWGIDPWVNQHGAGVVIALGPIELVAQLHADLD